jgi:dihydrofolate reductase
MRISAIVAMSENRVIGQGNQLPWRLPEDLKRFRAVTLGHSIIMGRKTFESIGRVLPQRENIIISRQVDYVVPGAKVVQSLQEAFQHPHQKSDEVFVIGGAEIYRLALPSVDRIYLTLIHKEIAGDAYFPELNPDEFRESTREGYSEPFCYSFITLDRI